MEFWRNRLIQSEPASDISGTRREGGDVGNVWRSPCRSMEAVCSVSWVSMGGRWSLGGVRWGRRAGLAGDSGLAFLWVVHSSQMELDRSRAVKR